MVEQERPSRFQLITFRQLLAAGISTRLMVDTTAQLFNPFLALIAVGVGVDVVTMGRLVSLRSAMGLLAPIFGSLADRIGYRTIMRFGLLLAAAGMFIAGSSNSVGTMAMGMVCIGLGLSSFVPNLHAYMSARLPYARRAQGLGMLEYSWALAGIAGLYLMGRLIELASWRAPFYFLGTGLVLAWMLFGRLPAARRAGQGRRPLRRVRSQLAWRRWPQQLTSFFKLGENSRSAYAAIVANALLYFSAFHIIIIHGGWLEHEYNLGAVALGTAALIQGVADLCGSVLVTFVTDRLGKRRSVLMGMAGVMGTYVALPFLNVALRPAVAGLALMHFCFEFSIVSNIPLLSEQVPQQRGKVMTLSAAFALSGGTLAGITGPWAYTQFGVWGLGPVSVVFAAMAFSVVLLRVQDRG